MKTICALVLSLLCIAPGYAQTPTDESIQTLLSVSQSQRLLDSMYESLDTQMKQMLSQMTNDKPVSAEQQRVMDSVTSKVTTIFREEMAWDKLTPVFVQIYKESLTQEDVDGLIAFYNSPAGLALMNKMPAVMQNSMVAMQPRLNAMMQRIKELMEQTKAELDAAK